MSFDREALARAIEAHGPVARIVVAEAKGSAPREAGAAMLVWPEGQSGTIGGGALEYEAARAARARLAEGVDFVTRQPLGPALGQCCGGAVTLLTEVWDAGRLAALDGPLLARPLPGGAAEPPLPVRRLLADARDRGRLPGPGLVSGWMAEPVSAPAMTVWIWGAGHVGRAIAAVLAPLPDTAVTLLDDAADRLPDPVPEGVTPRVAPDLPALAAVAPAGARHIVLTYSHGIDLALCHALLTAGADRIGLIGSATKRARFRTRLAALGHTPAAIDRIECPIGDPALGKHPQAIAIGVAASLLGAPAAARPKEASA